MGPKFSRIALILLMLTVAAEAGSDPLSKLDPRARIALSRLQAGVPVDALRARRDAVDENGMLDVFVRGAVSRADLEAAGARVRTELPGIFTASIPAGAVAAVAALKGVRSISGSAPTEPELEVSVPVTGVTALRSGGPAFTGAAGAGVILGDVDTGVDHNHGDFLNAGGTSRFVSIWDQTLGAGPNPIGYPYGTEFTTANLNTDLSNALPELTTDTSGHGTHVMGIAGGDGSQTGGLVPAYTYVGMAPRADLIMVKTTFGTAQIIDGVSYIFGKATSQGKPAVVNLSLGSQYGPHDGTSDFEAALSALSAPGRIVVKSAGNDRGAALHAELFATAGTNYAEMAVSGTGTSGAIFAIDGYYESTENLNFTVRTPNGTTLGPVTLGNINAGYPGTPTANGAVYFENGVFLNSQGDREVYVEVNVGAGQNMNGTWRFTFSPVAIGAANGEVDLWRFFQTSSPAVSANFTTGNQPNEEMISEPGNADSVITVAAYVTRDVWSACNGTLSTYGGPPPGSSASFSSQGPTRSGVQKPDITAPGTAIASTLTKDVSASCPPVATPSAFLGDGLNHWVIQGTSMAAPHVSGAVALLLEHYGAVSPSWIKQFLRDHADVSGTGGVWNKTWGWGKLHVPDIVNPAATVTAPNGGQVWNTGTSQNITWTATDVGGGVTSVDIRLSRTGVGGPFATIASGIPNTGSRSWVVSGPGTGNAFVEVVAHDAMGNSGSDKSNAAFTIVDVAGVGDGPRAFALGRIAPNPTPERATIEYALPREARVKLTIVDVQGRQVAVLADGAMPAGSHTVEWNGRIDGTRAPAGLYFVRFQTPEHTFVRRFALAR